MVRRIPTRTILTIAFDEYGIDFSK